MKKTLIVLFVLCCCNLLAQGPVAYQNNGNYFVTLPIVDPSGFNGPIGSTIPNTAVFTNLTSTGGALNGTVGATTPNTGVFTTVSATTGSFTTLNFTGGALNGSIGSTTPNTGVFTSLTSTSGALNGTIGATTPHTGVFTTLSSTTGSITNLTVTGTCTGCSGTVNWNTPGTIGSTTPNTGAFTSLTSTSGTLNGSIGATTPNTGVFTTVSATTGSITNLTVSGTCSGCTGAVNWSTPGTIGSTTPNTGAFTTVSASGGFTGNLSGNATTATTATTASAVAWSGVTSKPYPVTSSQVWDATMQSGQPGGLFGTSDGNNMHLWNPSNFSVNYANTASYASSATNATNATNASAVPWSGVTSKPTVTLWNWGWAGQPGQPLWLWGSNDGFNMYVWNPSNFSVSYATSAASATTASQLNSGGIPVNAAMIGTNGSGQLVSQTRTFDITYVIDGGGAAITTGTKGWLEVPVNCWLVGWTIVADQPGSISVDVGEGSYAAVPSAGSITGGNYVNLASVQKNNNFSLTGWNQTVTAGNWFLFNVLSASTVQRVTIALRATM